MKEFLQKAMRGASVLLILYVISSCGGEKQMDSSSLLMLLGPESSLQTQTDSYEAPSLGFQNTGVNQVEPESNSGFEAIEYNSSSEPDLMVYLISGGKEVEVKPGEDISRKIQVQVANFGGALAGGSSPANEGYMVDLILSQDQIVPQGYASYYPDFQEDVLLGGGRISNTPDLQPGVLTFVSEGSNLIPKNVPAGNYFLCARIDVGSKVTESNENNNTVCLPILVQSGEVLPDLIIPRASIYPSGMKCRAYKPMMYITAEIKNIGEGPSAAMPNVGIINALEPDEIHGNGIGYTSMIQPGETITVTFPIYFPINESLEVDTSLAEKKHTFDLRLNRGSWLQESNVQNNAYIRKPLELTIPEGYCKSHSN
ncbi:CARDB domain-containing protein [Leptospira noguchii]|uniref:Lipoprotein n=1 Tax=Leptospira noguchii str. 2007001578 TaxID=1049974 RepID=A0ABP2T8M0_9LEPT|nr:CARDB domain-containing protein [Leptospira noguchii]EMN00650.1 putative lipoprotein [Leptospira noguchii str. 2007001578]